MTMELFTTQDLANALGIQPVILRQWAARYPTRLPVPYATYSNGLRRLYTRDQMEALIESEKERPNLNGRVKKGKLKFGNTKVVNPDTGRELTFCPEEGCIEVVFDLKVHQDFFHKGKLSTKR